MRLHISLRCRQSWLQKPIRGPWKQREPMSRQTLIYRSGIALIFNQRELQSKATARLKKVHECANQDSLRESYGIFFSSTKRIYILHMFLLCRGSIISVERPEPPRPEAIRSQGSSCDPLKNMALSFQREVAPCFCYSHTCTQCIQSTQLSHSVTQDK